MSMFQEWQSKVYRQFFYDLMCYGEAILPYEAQVPIIVCYDPQKLLPHKPSLTGRYVGGNPVILLNSVRLSYPHIDRSPPMEEGRRFHVAVISGSDYGGIEARILAAAGISGVVGIHIDLEAPSGEFPPSFDTLLSFSRNPRYVPPPIFEDEDRTVDTAQGKRDKSYLKHDPSKSFKRRKR